MEDILTINGIQVDKYDTYDLLFEFLVYAYNKMKTDENEDFYLDVYELIAIIIGEENLDEFQDYTQDIH